MKNREKTFKYDRSSNISENKTLTFYHAINELICVLSFKEIYIKLI